jgi:hypothetical protein
VCDGSAVAETVEQVGREVVLFGTAPSAPASYLYLEFSDLSQTRLDLRLRYQSGRSETVQVRRSNRETNDGRYFLKLGGQVEQVALTLPGARDRNPSGAALPLANPKHPQIPRIPASASTTRLPSP